MSRQYPRPVPPRCARRVRQADPLWAGIGYAFVIEAGAVAAALTIGWALGWVG